MMQVVIILHILRPNMNFADMSKDCWDPERKLCDVECVCVCVCAGMLTTLYVVIDGLRQSICSHHLPVTHPAPSGDGLSSSID